MREMRSSKQSFKSLTQLEYRNITIVRPTPVAAPVKIEPPATKPLPPGLSEDEVALRVHRALADAEQRWAADAASREGNRQKQIEGFLDGFAAERAAYFGKAQAEVVRLALAIARKVIGTKVTVRPELPAQAARIALDQMSAASTIRLRVPPSEFEGWETRNSFAGTRYRCELIADSSVKSGDCVVETDLGSANFGLRSQMQQIEQQVLDAAGLPAKQHGEDDGLSELTDLAPSRRAELDEGAQVPSSLEERVNQMNPVRWWGRVIEVTGNLVQSEGPAGALGDECELRSANGTSYRGEIIGFRGRTVLSMMTQNPLGVRFGDPFLTDAKRPSMPVSDALLGRVISATGEPLDGGVACRGGVQRAIDGQAPQALTRVPIREPLGSGVRALDAFIPCGRGQRLGIFGGSGVGKSTLLGMMARGTAADVIVMALVGERGREVGEFLEVLGEEGLRRAVLVVSTSDQSPLLRLRAPLAATAIAEEFAAQGKNVLLVVDSLTRFAMAQREIGLAAGEPPTAKGYTPSVLNKLASLVERAGRFKTGSITAFYTVLMEGDDQQDPVVDTVRSLLDGHIILDRKLALSGHYPPISVLDSLSRLMPSITKPAHIEKASALRELLSAYSRSEDLVRIGAYQRGGDPLLDRAIEHLPALQGFLRQGTDELSSFEDAERLLLTLPS